MYTPKNIDYFIHARKEFLKQTMRLRTKKIKIPNKLVKKVSLKMFSKIMNDPTLDKKEDAEFYIPRLTVD